MCPILCDYENEGDLRMELPKEIRPAKDVVTSAVGEEVFLLHMHSERYYSLKGVGKRFWEEINRSHLMADVMKTLLDEYDVTEEVLKRDLLEFYEQLLDSELLEKSGD